MSLLPEQVQPTAWLCLATWHAFCSCSRCATPQRCRPSPCAALPAPLFGDGELCGACVRMFCVDSVCEDALGALGVGRSATAFVFSSSRVWLACGAPCAPERPHLSPLTLSPSPTHRSAQRDLYDRGLVPRVQRHRPARLRRRPGRAVQRGCRHLAQAAGGWAGKWGAFLPPLPIFYSTMSLRPGPH